MRSVPVSLGNTVFIHSCWGSGPNQVPNLRISTRQSGLLPVMNMKKAHDKSATWVCGTCRSRKVINYHNGGLRREVTVGLVTQLNEMLKCKDGVDRTKLHRLVKNLITQATTAGDLTAILAIYDRLEGRPSQKIVGPDNGPLQIEYKTIEEVHMFLLERGIDSLRVPPPPMKLVARTDAHACKKPALVDHAHRVAADQEPCRVLCVQRSLR